jgi:hypothetical protein
MGQNDYPLDGRRHVPSLQPLMSLFRDRIPTRQTEGSSPSTTWTTSLAAGMSFVSDL